MTASVLEGVDLEGSAADYRRAGTRPVAQVQEPASVRERGSFDWTGLLRGVVKPSKA